VDGLAAAYCADAPFEMTQTPQKRSSDAGALPPSLGPVHESVWAGEARSVNDALTKTADL
jgi:hypothetical protein